MNKSLRIAQVTATFPPYAGGTGNMCFYMSRELARCGHQVHIFTAARRGAPDEEQLDGLQVHRLRPILNVGNAPLLPGLSGLQGFDLIHLHYPFFGGEATVIAARREHIPLIITYHQDVHLVGLMSLVERVLRYTTGRWVLRSAQRVLFTSLDYSQASYARELLRQREQLIGALPNAVDATCFSPGRPPVGKPEAAFQVLLVASLDQAHYFKGVSVLLQALTRLPAETRAAIVGEGNLRLVYQQQAEKLGLKSRVTFPGRVSIAELIDYYRQASVTVLPSTTMGEAFGLVLLEAMACGTPVIASDLPGVRTVISHGVDGFLVPPNDPVALADCIWHLIRDPALVQRMGSRGREKVVKQYAWSSVVERLETVYREVLARHKLRQPVVPGNPR